MKTSLSMALTSNKQTLSVRHTVKDMLFDGYSDPLLDFAKKLPTFAGVDIPYDKFGWFYLVSGVDNSNLYFNYFWRKQIVQIIFKKYMDLKNTEIYLFIFISGIGYQECLI